MKYVACIDPPCGHTGITRVMAHARQMCSAVVLICSHCVQQHSRSKSLCVKTVPDKHMDNTAINKTSSSAIADRPRDASCLSVVSFSSTIPRVPSFVIVI